MFADTFIRRPVTAIVTSIVITLLGLVALLVLPVAQYPNIVPPTVVVNARFTGADAQTMEQTTTTTLETQINGVPGLNYLSSNSSTGSSSITANFQVGTDINSAAVELQNRVSTAQTSLPETVRRLGVTIRKRNPAIMMMVGFYSPKATHNPDFIGNYMNIVIKDALLRVKGVGDIFAVSHEFSMRVWLDLAKLNQLGLSPKDIANAINDQHLDIAPGTLGAMPQNSNQVFEYPLLVDSRLYTKEEFEQIVVRTNPQTSSLIRLKDVARVELGAFDYSKQAVVDGKPGAILLIYQTPDANTLTTYNSVLEALEKMKPSFPKDLDYIIPNESATVIKTSIKEVLHTFIEALALVVLVVFLFLQNWRATLIPVLAIPVSLIGTFIFFVPLGFSINTLTMFAFVLAIGIVVDDAIVVVEAVQHNMDTYALSAVDATRKAMREISGPVVAIALILAVVFIPVSFIPGITGRLYQQFALTIAVSVMLSAFVALSLTPALCTLILRPSKENKTSRLTGFFRGFNHYFELLTLWYVARLRGWIRARAYVILLVLAIVVALFYLFEHKPRGFVPLEDEGRLYVVYQLPEGAATGRSSEVMQEIVKTIQDVPAVKTSGGIVGFNIANFSAKSNAGTLMIKLKDWSLRTHENETVAGVISELQRRFAHIQQAIVRIVAPPPIPGLGVTAGFAVQVQQVASTDSFSVFEKIANDFIVALKARPEIATAYTFFTSRTPTYKLALDRTRCQQLGVRTSEVYQTISSLFASNYVKDFSAYGRNFHVVLMAEASDRQFIADFNKLYVKNTAGALVPLSFLVQNKLVEAPSIITHHNVQRAIEVNGLPAQGYSSAQALDAIRAVATQMLPTGYDIAFSGMSFEEAQSGNNTIYIFAGAVIFVFLFLAALYESWSVPFAVLFALPVGIFGAIFTLYWLPKITNNIYAQIGMLTILGLSAKNAILIVEYAKLGVDQGKGVIEATLEAARMRLRPILMTSFAFILGVLPLMYASGAAHVSRNTIGWTVFGGMIAASSLAIFVVPACFVLIVYRKKREVKKCFSNKILGV